MMRPSSRATWIVIALCLATASTSPLRAQQAPAPLPKPPEPTGEFQVIQPRSPRVIVDNTRRIQRPARPQRTAYSLMGTNVLAFNQETLSTTLAFGKPKASFTFHLTNVSPDTVTIQSVRTSCGCTVPKLPPVPWALAAGEHGQFSVQMNVAGKTGTVVKSVTVQTDKGFKTLYVRTTIEPPPAGQMGSSDRLRNMQIAMANRQMVFHGDCASCHAAPAEGKTGEALFKATCSVCHEAEHRASMVPDLHALQKETNADYWRSWITTGNPGTLMPAFSKEHRGILSEHQIDTLVDYLLKAIPSTTNVTKPAGGVPPAAP